MQTIKTAAIVVLLMSVIYAAYISLTTPPEPLPADVEDMLVMDGQSMGTMESTLPPSLAELGISAGEVTGEVANQTSPTGESTPFGIADVESGIAANGNPNNGNPNSTGSLETAIASATPSMMGEPNSSPNGQLGIPNQPAAQPTNSTSGFSASLSDNDVPSFDSGQTAASLASSALGTANTPSSSESPSTGGKYPTTGRTFQMPDPNQLDAGSLNSGTNPNSAAKATAPTGEVAQVAAINSGENLGLVNAIRSADFQYQNDQRREALSTLSIFYSTPNLSGEQRSELLSRLDPLAAAVIYSPEHLLERPYRVANNETLMEIADRYEVPWQLLANINQVRDPVAIVPGTELKVVRGPFRAEVDLTNSELTLFLGDLYAGRFPIAVGSDPSPKLGTFTVQDKQNSRTFYDASGAPVPPGTTENPYGSAWIDLGGQLCIHGSPYPTRPSERGCISLAGDFADDLFGILSQGSSVTIKR